MKVIVKVNNHHLFYFICSLSLKKAAFYNSRPGRFWYMRPGNLANLETQILQITAFDSEADYFDCKCRGMTITQGLKEGIVYLS